MSTPYVGEIRIFACNFAPQGWYDCEGQLLSIADNDVLFNLIGTTWGGDGQTTFALPDLRGTVPVHMGQGPGLTPRVIGERAGTETVTLSLPQLPAHSHGWTATTAAASTGAPSSSVQLAAVSGDALYTGDVSGIAPIACAANAVSIAGSSQPHDNTMPTLPLRICISSVGLYPSQS